MRKELKDRVGRRGRFRATFNRFGALRKAWGHPQQCTALLKNVRDESGAIVADHIWVIVGTRFGALELKPGDEVFFVARVTKYRKRNPDWQDEDDTPLKVVYRVIPLRALLSRHRKALPATHAQRRPGWLGGVSGSKSA